MGKSLVIKGADFSVNAIEQVTPPTPPAVLGWNIGNISSTGVLREVDTAIYSDMVAINAGSVSIFAVSLDDSYFSVMGPTPVIALYTEDETFITRIVGNKSAGASANISSYPTATKARFAIGDIKNNVTDVDVALSKLTYEITGVTY